MFYLSHVDLQSVWNLFLCMIWARRILLSPDGNLIAAAAFIKKIICSSPNCSDSTVLPCMCGSFMDPLFCFIGLYTWLYARTPLFDYVHNMLTWDLNLCNMGFHNMFWSQEKWGLQFSSFSRLLWLFMVLCGPYEN